MMLLCLLATLALLIAIESGRTRWWVAYAVAVAAAAYTHYPSVFVLIVLFGWAFFARPQARKPLVLANLGAALLFAPWSRSSSGTGTRPPRRSWRSSIRSRLTRPHPTWSAGRSGTQASAPEVLPGNLALWLIGAGALAGAVGLVTRLRAEPSRGSGLRPPRSSCSCC